MTESAFLVTSVLKGIYNLDWPGNKSQDWIEIARARMTARGKSLPSTKAGAVRALWPAIEVALANGQSLKSVRTWLEEEGICLTYNQLTSYVGRIRRSLQNPKSAGLESTKAGSEPSTTLNADVPQVNSVQVLDASKTISLPSTDPLANIRAREQKRPTFEYNPNFKEDELI